MADPVNEVLKKTFRELEARYDRRENPVISTTYIESLDQAIGPGFWAGDFVIIAGQPASGKTTLAIQLLLSATQDLMVWPLYGNAKNLAGLRSFQQQNRTYASVLIFAPKDGSKKYLQKMLSAMGGPPLPCLTLGRIWQKDWPRLTVRAGMLSELPIEIDDGPAPTIAEFEESVKGWRENATGPGVVVIDSLQYLKDSGAPGRRTDKAEISRRLKRLSRTLGVVIIGVSSLDHREGEDSVEDDNMSLHALGESRAFADDADSVLMTDIDFQYTNTQGTIKLVKHLQSAGVEISVKPVWLQRT